MLCYVKLKTIYSMGKCVGVNAVWKIPWLRYFFHLNDASNITVSSEPRRKKQYYLQDNWESLVQIMTATQEWFFVYAILLYLNSWKHIVKDIKEHNTLCLTETIPRDQMQEYIKFTSWYCCSSINNNVFLLAMSLTSCQLVCIRVCYKLIEPGIAHSCGEVVSHLCVCKGRMHVLGILPLICLWVSYHKFLMQCSLLIVIVNGIEPKKLGIQMACP